MSASSIDPDIQAAFNDGPPSASSHSNIDADILDAYKADGESKTNAPKTSEVTTGPLGFINGAAELAGKGILNIPYTAMHGAQDVIRRAAGSDTNAPDSEAALLAAASAVGARSSAVRVLVDSVHCPGSRWRHVLVRIGAQDRN